jgi:hypothetical protein
MFEAQSAPMPEASPIGLLCSSPDRAARWKVSAVSIVRVGQENSGAKQTKQACDYLGHRCFPTSLASIIIALFGGGLISCLLFQDVFVE